MAKEQLTLKLIVENGRGKESINLSGIPMELWEPFVNRCARYLEGEDPNTAWSRIFAGVIQSEFLTREVIIPYLKSQKAGEYTFLLAGIPLQARDNFDMYCSQANLTPDLLVALMYQAAMSGDIHILNMRPPDEHTGYHVLVTAGITDETWGAWSSLARRLSDAAGESVSPEELLGHLFERVLSGHVTVTDNDPGSLSDKAPVDAPKTNSLEDDVGDLKDKLDKLMEQMRNG